MLDLDKLLGQMLGSSQGKSLAGGLLMGGLAGALTGKTGQKVATAALKLGGAAAVAGIAYKAFQQYRASQSPGGVQLPSSAGRLRGPFPATFGRGESDEGQILPPAAGGFLPPSSDRSSTDALSSKLINAMISVAKADGRLDANESERIFRQVEEFGLAAEEKHFLLAAVSHPWTVEQVAAAAASPEEAADIYAASVLAANPGGLAEEAHLNRLAQLMKIDPELAQTIHRRVALDA